MPNPIFPTSITQFSTESLIKKHSTKSKAIYWLLIFSVVSFAVSLFWIKVDVNVHSKGIVTSKELATKIIAPVYGKIARLQMKENGLVQKGDTLLEIDTLEITRSIGITKENITELQEQNADLKILSSLTRNSHLSSIKLHTQLLDKELQKFVSDLRYQKSEIAIQETEYIRQKQLYEKDVIPLADYEQITYKYRNTKLMYDKIFDNQIAQWQNKLYQNKKELRNNEQNLNKLQKELLKYFIAAPITGYIQKLVGLKTGGSIYPNQEICTISPTSDLIVETYVSTTDIGLIKQNQDVKFRVDAFNFNQWGMLKGKVSEIANDINISDKGTPNFKIRCTLLSHKLSYQGKTVKVKKGMTVNANFLLTQRTLAQLFYDNITDWLDPNEIKK